MSRHEKQTDCFEMQIKFMKCLGIWPTGVTWPHYKIFSIVMFIYFIMLFHIFSNLSIYFLPKNVNDFVQECIFYFTDFSVLSKVLTIVMMRKDIDVIMETLERDVFQPTTEKELEIVRDAKRFNIKYWRIMLIVTLLANINHIFPPLFSHIFKGTVLDLPVCSYSFLPNDIKEKYYYLLYCYQWTGIYYHAWSNFNVDTYFAGLMNLTIAQLDILDGRFRSIVQASANETNTRQGLRREKKQDDYIQLKKCIIHFDKVATIFNLIQKVFSITLFVQFTMESCIICICLFRFTLPASIDYYMFLGNFLILMVCQILIPCWFGTRITDKTLRLSNAIYDCDWTSRSRRFKTILLLQVERTNRPLTLMGWKMFSVSLTTFTSIMRTAYSFFTLLRNVQGR